MIKWILSLAAGAAVYAKRNEILKWVGNRFAGRFGGGGDWSTGCPPATQNVEINTKNRDATIRLFMYGPANPNLPSLNFWNKYAKLWSRGKTVTPELLSEVRQMRCGNCAVFDVSPRMKQCLPPVGEPYDSPGSVPLTLGYCWAHHFKCASTRTCSTWAAGGPITAPKISDAFFQKYGK